MRLIPLGVFLLAAVGLLGCTVSSPRGGGSGAGDGFTIAAPRAAVSLKAGGERDVTVSVKRSRSFKHAVALGIRASDGVMVEPTNVLNRSGEKSSAAIRVSAPKDTRPGDYRVYVKGTPAAGEPTSIEFIVRVTGP